MKLIMPRSVLAAMFLLSGNAIAADALPPIVLAPGADLAAHFVPDNAGRTFLLRAGDYLVSTALTVPEGASIVGAGVMLFDDDGHGSVMRTEVGGIRT